MKGRAGEKVAELGGDRQGSHGENFYLAVET